MAVVLGLELELPGGKGLLLVQQREMIGRG